MLAKNARRKETMSNRPKYELIDFPLRLAIWEKEDKNGHPYFYSKLTKAQKKQDGQGWENTEFLSGQDWVRAAALLQQANHRYRIRTETPSER